MTEETASPQAETPATAVTEVDNGPVDLDADNPDGLAAVDKENAEENTTAENDATAETDEGEAEADDEDDGEAVEPEVEAPVKPKKTSGIARLKAQLAEAQAELVRLQSIAPKADNAAALAQAVERKIGPEPVEADFADFLDYRDAKAAYAADKRAVTRQLTEAAEATQNQAKIVEEAEFEEFRAKADDARKRIKDFDEVVGKATVSPTHADTIRLIVTSDKSAELAYHLSKNPKLVNQINAMHPIQQAREIGKLEASISAAKPKTETKAPEPVPPVKGGKSATKDPDKMSITEFDAYYAARVKARHG